MEPESVHLAITRRVRKTQVAEFEKALAEFASRALNESGARGVHFLYPPPGSGSTEYGIVRSFATAADREAFRRTPLFREWLARVEPMSEGEPIYRQLDGLEAWFRDPQAPLPPRWKMAVVTWAGCWPVSVVVRAAVLPLIGPLVPAVVAEGVAVAGIVALLTWVAMPLLTRLAKPWLQPAPARAGA
jgi:antibiotic biosynthesis monooxygenase (ABM) superfamily enzyme